VFAAKLGGVVFRIDIGGYMDGRHRARVARR
jgi:hypothetical protein